MLSKIYERFCAVPFKSHGTILARTGCSLLKSAFSRRRRRPAGATGWRKPLCGEIDGVERDAEWTRVPSSEVMFETIDEVNRDAMRWRSRWMRLALANAAILVAAVESELSGLSAKAAKLQSSVNSTRSAPNDPRAGLVNRLATCVPNGCFGQPR